jgi:hypothetical protein
MPTTPAGLRRVRRRHRRCGDGRGDNKRCQNLSHDVTSTSVDFLSRIPIAPGGLKFPFFGEQELNASA